ncbi:uncharacterized protein LOC144761771 [Lissotriton helveticus]
MSQVTSSSVNTAEESKRQKQETNSCWTSGILRREAGDSAYAVCSFILSPYLKPSTLSEMRFNAAHRSTRNVIERTVGLLKSHYCCLHKTGGALQYRPDTCCKIVATCAMLHNIATLKAYPWNYRILNLAKTRKHYNHNKQQVHRVQQKEDGQRRAEITQNYF